MAVATGKIIAGNKSMFKFLLPDNQRFVNLTS